MAFGGDIHDLGSFREETDEIMDLHQIVEEILLTERGDGVAGIKRRRRDPSGDGVRRIRLGKRECIERIPSGRFDVFFRDQLLVFQQHQDESLYDSWTHFKDVIRKVRNHGLSIWTPIEFFLKHLDSLSHHIINLTAKGDLRKFSDIGAWVQVPRCMVWLDYDEHVDSLRKFSSFDGPEPQPLLNSPSLDVSLGDVIGPEPPIKQHSPDSSRMKVVDYLTTQTLPLPHMENSHPKGVYSYYNPGIDDPKRHYGFKPSLLGKSVSLDVDISNWEMFNDDWGLESKEVSPLGEELSLLDRQNKVEM
ncbi:hypothetical protein Tco_0529563 [Tanacetum coccineum]